MLLLLHDGIWFVCPHEIRENAKALIRQVMENSMSLSVPLVVTFD
jgi:DNA polymerase I-like protein with 3'-5' exonuclease and polymerase domains